MAETQGSQGIECPSCESVSPTIEVKELGRFLLLGDDGKWHWSDDTGMEQTFYCSVCGEELGDWEALQRIVDEADAEFEKE